MVLEQFLKSQKYTEYPTDLAGVKMEFATTTDLALWHHTRNRGKINSRKWYQIARGFILASFLH